jgi:SAM-dependent methyltransferase
MDLDHLSTMAASYDAHASDREEAGEPDWRDEIRSDFVARLPDGGRVLEIGAGVGYTSKWFLDQGIDIVATDLSPANVELCRAKGVPAEVRDMADLGFPDRSFSGVWAASCLMHVATADLDAVFTEINRVLVAGGLFWAGTWGGATTEGIWAEDRYEPKRFYSIRDDDLMRSLYAPHFEVLSFDSFSPMPDLDWHYQSALLRAGGAAR